LDEKLG